MRVWGLCLVVLTLALGTGGVGRRPVALAGDEKASPARADDADGPSAALDTIVQQAAKSRAWSPAICRAARVAPPVEIALPNKAPAHFISLNRTGYNYRAPGTPPQIVPDSLGSRKPASPQR